MEDVREDIGPEWPVEHYAVVARHLGQFNGAYLTGERPMPAFPWLRRRSHLRDSVARRAANRARTLAELHNSLDHPVVRRAYPPDVVEILSREWGEDGKLKDTRLLDALDRLPQTLCHNDAFRRNLLARHRADGRPQTVVIDWAFVGIGVLRAVDADKVQAAIRDAVQPYRMDGQGYRMANWFRITAAIRLAILNR
jgi:uncharacterized protein YbjT (DUF2867 family)